MIAYLSAVSDRILATGCNKVPHVYIDITGDLVAGTLLSKIISYFHSDNCLDYLVRKNDHLWLVKQRTEWWNEIRITERQYDRAIKILVSKGFVITKIFLLNGITATHIRINTMAIIKAIDKFI